ncbi:MAG: GAF domain-containing protein, partial [Deltaproteobacteria bacterium]|nr:GAF domain-containing protein [Deltaproteobacteria bacterium]
LDSIDLFKEVEEAATTSMVDRPMTAKNNFDLVLKVSNVLMESLNIDDILRRILKHILDLLKRIDRGVIILIDEESGKVRDVVSIFKEDKDDTITMYSRTVVDRVLKERRAVIMLDTMGEEKTDLSDSIEIQNIRSILCIPLISRSHVMGVLYVDSVNRPHGFRNEDLSLLTALSSPAAIAIENAMLHSGEPGGTLH